MPLTLTLAASQWVVGLLIVLGIAASVIMILMVLIQRPQGGGLSAAFGGAGAGSGQTAFGAKTGDALTIATITVFVLWLLIAVGLVYATKRPTELTGSGAEQAERGSDTAPVAVPTDLTPVPDQTVTTPAPVEVPESPVSTPETGSSSAEDGGESTAAAGDDGTGDAGAAEDDRR